MKTVNSLSGGKTSSYLAVHYPADYNLFALVCTDDTKCLFPDKKLRQEVSDKIGREFIGTLEEDMIIYTMLDLEQYLGKKIHWVAGQSFDEVIDRGDGKKYLPNVVHRFCTTEMKIRPMFEWWYENFEEPVEMRIGFRANEARRVARKMAELNADGLAEFDAIVGVRKDGKYKHKMIAWQNPIFPLYDDGIFKDTIEEFWKDKPVRFAYMNNCVGCFHRNPMLLKFMSMLHPNKFEWFAEQEQSRHEVITFKNGITYRQIKEYPLQFQLDFDDFDECDDGYCGL